MKKFIIFITYVFLTACATSTPIKDDNRAYGQLYLTDPDTMRSILIETIDAMDDYEVKNTTSNMVTAFYNPTNPFFGSATIDIVITPASGRTYEGDTVRGMELIMIDKTRWFSEDTSFSAADIMSLIKGNVKKAAEFSKIETTMVYKK
jgi:hypothetical protein